MLIKRNKTVLNKEWESKYSKLVSKYNNLTKDYKEVAGALIKEGVEGGFVCFDKKTGKFYLHDSAAKAEQKERGLNNDGRSE